MDAVLFSSRAWPIAEVCQAASELFQRCCPAKGLKRSRVDRLLGWQNAQALPTGKAWAQLKIQVIAW
jgi:hypothetical protein